MKNKQGMTRFTEDAMFLDPGLPEVRAYIISMVEEIAKSYDIDGIHYDRLIYPRRDSGYNEKSIARFNAETKRKGIPNPDDKDWCEWRIKQVTQLMLSTSQAVKRIKPRVQVSASVLSDPKSARWNHLQDWPDWLDQGVMDFAVPMLFLKDTEMFTALLPDMLSAGKGKPVYVGLGVWQIPMSQSLKQLQAVRDAGARGVILYNYDAARQTAPRDNTSLLDALKAGMFAKADTVSPQATDSK